MARQQATAAPQPAPPTGPSPAQEIRRVEVLPVSDVAMGDWAARAHQAVDASQPLPQPLPRITHAKPGHGFGTPAYLRARDSLVFPVRDRGRGAIGEVSLVTGEVRLWSTGVCGHRVVQVASLRGGTMLAARFHQNVDLAAPPDRPLNHVAVYDTDGFKLRRVLNARETLYLAEDISSPNDDGTLYLANGNQSVMPLPGDKRWGRAGPGIYRLDTATWEERRLWPLTPEAEDQALAALRMNVISELYAPIVAEPGRLVVQSNTYHADPGANSGTHLVVDLPTQKAAVHPLDRHLSWGMGGHSMQVGDRFVYTNMPRDRFQPWSAALGLLEPDGRTSTPLLFPDHAPVELEFFGFLRHGVLNVAFSDDGFYHVWSEAAPGEVKVYPLAGIAFAIPEEICKEKSGSAP